MRLLAWNILHGGGASRLPEIALSLLEQAPDIVVLSEFRPGRGGQLRAVLADHGLASQACSGSDPSRNSILIASRWPVEVVEHGVDPGKDLSSRWLSVRVRGAFELELIGVHIPDDSRPSAKSRLWQALLDVARPRADGRTIIAGDTNSGRPRVDGDWFGCVTALGKLATMGYVDAWRHQNPQSREDTWSHPFAGRGRIDGIYLSRTLGAQLRDAALVHEARRAGHSDHSMVRVDLDDDAPKTVENHLGTAPAPENRKKTVENCDFLPW